jgi:hypothetical protein
MVLIQCVFTTFRRTLVVGRRLKSFSDLWTTHSRNIIAHYVVYEYSFNILFK